MFNVGFWGMFNVGFWGMFNVGRDRFNIGWFGEGFICVQVFTTDGTILQT